MSRDSLSFTATAKNKWPDFSFRRFCRPTGQEPGAGVSSGEEEETANPFAQAVPPWRSTWLAVHRRSHWVTGSQRKSRTRGHPFLHTLPRARASALPRRAPRVPSFVRRSAPRSLRASSSRCLPIAHRHRPAASKRPLRRARERRRPHAAWRHVAAIPGVFMSAANRARRAARPWRRGGRWAAAMSPLPSGDVPLAPIPPVLAQGRAGGLSGAVRDPPHYPDRFSRTFHDPVLVRHRRSF